MDFPAVAQSRLAFWGKPQYTRTGMWWFTLIFGIFGIHHLLLRSPQTALMMLIANMFSFGYWWIWDLIQLSNVENVGVDLLNTYGMDVPWGAMGIAQGMWLTK